MKNIDWCEICGSKIAIENGLCERCVKAVKESTLESIGCAIVALFLLTIFITIIWSLTR